MFGSKKDRKIVELVIEFNLDAISRWIADDGEIEDIEKMEKNWKNCLIRTYRIDVLPNGQMSNMYFHREKGLISSNMGGIDFLENTHASMKNFCEKNKIQILGWERWREYLSLRINKKPILLVPIKEFGIIQTGGKLDNQAKILGREERAVQVPISFSEDGKPKNHIQIWRSSASSESVGYSNALASVSASILNFEVEY